MVNWRSHQLCSVAMELGPLLVEIRITINLGHFLSWQFVALINYAYKSNDMNMWHWVTATLCAAHVIFCGTFEYALI